MVPSNKQQLKRYSEAFKRQVVAEYEQGASVTWLQRKYGIGGAQTIKRWVQRYGRQPFRTEVVLVQTAEDVARFREMAQRIEALEHLVSELVLENRKLRAALEVHKVDVKKSVSPSCGTCGEGETSP